MTDDSRVAASKNDPDEPEVVTSDLLVEEVSIDGMCGVY
ncbi:mycofactocin precursor MftA [Sciscionella sediminilitoris]|nr:mycofactocin precursor MftA [Sciscionella sp. SE31]